MLPSHLYLISVSSLLESCDWSFLPISTCELHVKLVILTGCQSTHMYHVKPYRVQRAKTRPFRGFTPHINYLKPFSINMKNKNRDLRAEASKMNFVCLHFLTFLDINSFCLSQMEKVCCFVQTISLST